MSEVKSNERDYSRMAKVCNALNEALMLKPGPNGWDKYCQLVAEAYAAAPIRGKLPLLRFRL